MSSLLSNVRYALRQLRKSPGFTVTAVLTLALGIGASTAIFTLFDQALLRSLPVKDPQKLALLRFSGDNVGHVNEQGGDHEGAHPYFSYPMYRDLRDKSSVFNGLIATAVGSAGVSWHNSAEAVPAEIVSGNYFEVLGVGPAVGRLFAGSDETAPGANPVAVLSFDYWKRRFNEDPTIVGQSITLNGTAFTVVGVVAPGFQSVVWGDRPRLFIPMTMQKAIAPDNDMADRRSIWLKIIGRLPEGRTTKQAEAGLNPLWTSLREMEFKGFHDQSARAREKFVTTSHLSVTDAAKGFSPMRESVETPLKILMGMVLLVVAMAAVNMASLLLVRAAGRVREFSMRYALGASTRDVVLQLLTEGVLLGVCGAILGIIMAPQMVRLLIAWLSSSMPDTPFSAELNPDILAFALITTLLVSVLFSLAPALQFMKPNLVDSLKQQSGTGTAASLKFRRSCVALQIGFSLLLLVGAGLFMRTIQNLHAVNVGFATDHLLTFGLSPEMAGYQGDSVAAVEVRVLDAISGLPGVRGVAATNDPELADDDINGSMDIAGYTPKPDEEVEAEVPWVSQDYFSTIGIPLVAGRGFTKADVAGAQKIAVVNEMFARKYFGSPANALGHHVSRSRRPVTDTAIVGVVRDAKHTTVRDEIRPTVYRPFVQGEKPTYLSFYVRTWQTPEAASNEIRAAVQRIDGKLIVDDLRTLQNQIDDTISTERMIAMLASVFGALAALLAGIGLYGVLAYSTAQRTREIGIRMALGAQRFTVAKLILREVLVLAAGTILVTLPIAFVLTHKLREQLFGVSPADPLVYLSGIVMIGIVASLAALLPARRAASIEPMQALRTE
ncbi:ABC transporter permease [Alloacidobacterium dinghuense]|uniref:ABC transporter permease n=1 Tax=Alloacidobacterium dinghuense TaxID=2763107 RepID=A0A7G8BP24_9BACT|nr:ABC transporter permease [Alloacidobacterium dinghuense]QNI34294.1 ABC transporter permease [Alloacidobacterium dinghuense]